MVSHRDSSRSRTRQRRHGRPAASATNPGRERAVQPYHATGPQAPRAAGFEPLTVAATADDHKAYYPGAEPIAMRWTGDVHSGRLLGVQLVGRLGSEIAKHVDVAAIAIHCGLTVDRISHLDLAYTPPLGSPWDAVQIGAWLRAHVRQPDHVRLRAVLLAFRVAY